MNADTIENTIDSTDGLGLSDRGIGVQAAGFAITGCISIAILHLYSGSDHVLYQWFETAVKDIYWAYLFPLAALLDWGRKMFARGKAIREAKKAEIRQAGVEEGMQVGVKQTRQALERQPPRLGGEIRHPRRRPALPRRRRLNPYWHPVIRP